MNEHITDEVVGDMRRVVTETPRSLGEQAREGSRRWHILIGPAGAVHFAVLVDVGEPWQTTFYGDVLRPLPAPSDAQHSDLHPDGPSRPDFLYPELDAPRPRRYERLMGLDVGYHAYEPLFPVHVSSAPQPLTEKQSVRPCEWLLSSSRCYYAGSSLRADHWLLAWSQRDFDEDWLWQCLRRCYAELFEAEVPRPFSVPERGDSSVPVPPVSRPR